MVNSIPYDRASFSIYKDALMLHRNSRYNTHVVIEFGGVTTDLGMCIVDAVADGYEVQGIGVAGTLLVPRLPSEPT